MPVTDSYPARMIWLTPKDVENSPGVVAVRMTVYLLAAALLLYGFHWWTRHYPASEAAEQYAIAKALGDQAQMCFHASVAADAFGAIDAAEKIKWRRTAAAVCED